MSQLVRSLSTVLGMHDDAALCFMPSVRMLLAQVSTSLMPLEQIGQDTLTCLS
jgi:hypothetical protein